MIQFLRDRPHRNCPPRIPRCVFVFAANLLERIGFNEITEDGFEAILLPPARSRVKFHANNGRSGRFDCIYAGRNVGKMEVKRFQYFRTISSKAKFSRYSTRLSNSTRLYAQAVSHVSTCSTPFLSHPTSFSVGIAPSIFP